MSVKPMSRRIMRGLKAQKDETNRINQIQRLVSGFYTGAIRKAETTSETVYQSLLVEHCRYGEERLPLDFNSENIQEIVRDLQTLFPECSVEYKNLARAQDGKMYDISKIDDTNRKFINMSQSEKYIVIDWS